jgi:hypothetical protein
MLSTERNEYEREELARGATIIREGMAYVVRHLSMGSGRIILGNPKFSEEFVGRVLQLCRNYTLLSDVEALYAAIINEASLKPVTSDGDKRYFQSFWLSSAKKTIRTVRDGACFYTDTSLFTSISGVADCLEEFAVNNRFDERKFVQNPDPLQVDGQTVQPIASCPAIGIVRTWAEAYSLSRRIVAIVQPGLIPADT